MRGGTLRAVAVALALAGAPLAAPAHAAAAAGPGACAVGGITCLDRLADEMAERLRPLVASCDHRAPFSLLYLRVTEELDRTIAAGEGGFADPGFVTREARTFADRYFAAVDDWAAGRRDRVDPAWRVALAAADGRQVSGLGDILLAMNAHIMNDLPFVLAGMGLADASGASRKPDHDLVNAVLRRAYGPALAETAARFDPTIDDVDAPGTALDQDAFFQSVVAWREAAWRDAELLAAAPTPSARDAVAAQIRATAAAQAEEIRAGTAYVWPVSTTAPRDAWCAGHGAGP